MREGLVEKYKNNLLQLLVFQRAFDLQHSYMAIRQLAPLPTQNNDNKLVLWSFLLNSYVGQCHNKTMLSYSR